MLIPWYINFQTDHQDSEINVFISFDLETLSQFSYYIFKSASVCVFLCVMHYAVCSYLYVQQWQMLW